MKPINEPHKQSLRQLLKWINNPADFLEESIQRYGEDYTVEFPGKNVITFLSNPKSIEDILTTPRETFDFERGVEVFGPLVRKHSLMRLDIASHKRHRQLIMPALHGDRMRLYGRLICEMTEKMMQQWRVGTTFNLKNCIHQVTLNVLLDVVIGFTKDERSQKLRRASLSLIEIANSQSFGFHMFLPFLQIDLGPWSLWGRFLRLQKEFEELLYPEIAQRLQQPDSDRTDILTMLLSAKDEQGESMSKEELCDEVITLLLTGYDTTTMTLLWAFYWLHKTPQALERLMAEIDSVSDPSDTKKITQLPYLTATIQETTRINPAILVGAPRVLATATKIRGYEFASGAEIWPSIYSAQRRQEVYPEPEKFQPERFLGRQYSPYEFLPFGGGYRFCVGNVFAQYQMKLVLFTILSNYELALTDSRPVRRVRRGPGVQPAKPLRMKVTARHRRQSHVPVSV
ncbi:MAG: cytochrome P450 [Calothrix sp. MO_192.B10]|nr:cytochrome P450 [Calothrix sp. MO_192.B10]